MKLTEFVSKKAIRTSLDSRDKEGVIREMAEALAKIGGIAQEDVGEVVDAILHRESIGSTALGRGVAVPHAKHPRVQQTVGSISVCEEGVDFKSLDGEKTQLFFLLISPTDKPADHLNALEIISRCLRDGMFCKFLKQSKTPADIWELLKEADDNANF